MNELMKTAAINASTKRLFLEFGEFWLTEFVSIFDSFITFAIEVLEGRTLGLVPLLFEIGSFETSTFLLVDFLAAVFFAGFFTASVFCSATSSLSSK